MEEHHRFEVVDRETWRTHAGMVSAMLGTAIGLGNVWRFPYLCGKHGGGSFIVPYVILLVGVGIFAMMAEWALGRYTKRDPLGAFERVGFPAGRDVGAWGIIGPFFLNSYYCYVASWVLYYIFASLGGLYFGQDTAAFFTSFLGGKGVFVSHALVVASIVGILALGVQKGIERACKIMIPSLFVLLCVLVVRALTLPGAWKGVVYYMQPRWSETMKLVTWFDALGQIFFTLSLGMGAMLMYGSYLKDHWGIPRNAILCTLGNSSCSILAGFAIFPAAFALGLGLAIQGEQSIGLTFIVLPRLFAKMGGGAFFGALFFVLLLFGAISSALSIQEPMVAWLVDEARWPRGRASVVAGILLWALGLPYLLNGRSSGGIGEKLALMSKMDAVLNNVALPLFSLLCVIAVTWVLGRRGFEEINKNARLRLNRASQLWLKYVVPLFILVLLVLLLAQTAGMTARIPALTDKGHVPVDPASITSVDAATKITITLVLLTVWGGCLWALVSAVVIERRKERGLVSVAPEVE